MDIIKSWSEMTLDSYLDIQAIDLDDELPFFSKSLEKLCILTESDQWEDEPSSIIYNTILNNSWLLAPPSTNVIENIDNWRLKPFKKFTLAEWIDLDNYVTSGKYENIIAIIYRKHKVDEWGNVMYEPYQFNCTERSEEFMDISIDKLFGGMKAAIEYRSKVLNAFNGLFSQMEDENFIPDEEDEKYLTPREIEEQRKTIKEENKRKKFAWQFLLDQVSGGDWSRIEEILELPAVFVFNMMSMKKVFNS